MTAWQQIEDVSASHRQPSEPSPEPGGRPAWLAPLLLTSALILVAVVMLVVVPNALGAGGGCGGG